MTLADAHEQHWTRTDQLLAVIADRLEELIYVETMVATERKDRSRIPKPEPIERPGVERRRRRGTTVGQLVALGAEVSHAGS